MNADAADPGSTEQRRPLLQIEAAYREWTRNRADVDKLCRLQEAIGECPEGLAGTVQR